MSAPFELMWVGAPVFTNIRLFLFSHSAMSRPCWFEYDEPHDLWWAFASAQMMKGVVRDCSMSVRLVRRVLLSAQGGRYSEQMVSWEEGR